MTDLYTQAHRLFTNYVLNLFLPQQCQKGQGLHMFARMNGNTVRIMTTQTNIYMQPLLMMLSLGCTEENKTVAHTMQLKVYFSKLYQQR